MAIARGSICIISIAGSGRSRLPGVKSLRADISNADEARGALADHQFDVVVDWVAYHPGRHRARSGAVSRPHEAVRVHQLGVGLSEAADALRDHRVDAAGESALGVFAEQDRLRRAAAGGVSRERLSRDDRAAVAHLRSATADRARRLGLLHVHRPAQAGQADPGAWRRLVAVGGDARRGFRPRVSWACWGTIRRSATRFTSRPTKCSPGTRSTRRSPRRWASSRSWCTSRRRRSSASSPEHHGGLLGDKTWSVVFDNTKIKTWVPGFHCEIPFREGIRRTVAQFEADTSRQRIDDAVNRDLDHILEVCGYARGLSSFSPPT